MQLIAELRDKPVLQDLPIVVISAAHQFDRAQFPEEIVWLHKPITNAQLLAAVESAWAPPSRQPMITDRI